MKRKAATDFLKFTGIFLLLIQFSCRNNPSGTDRINVNDQMPSGPLSRLMVDPANPRHFSDTTGKPVFLIGDSPQNLPQKLSVKELRAILPIADQKVSTSAGSA